MQASAMRTCFSHLSGADYFWQRYIKFFNFTTICCKLVSLSLHTRHKIHAKYLADRLFFRTFATDKLDQATSHHKTIRL